MWSYLGRCGTLVIENRIQFMSAAAYAREAGSFLTAFLRLVPACLYDRLVQGIFLSSERGQRL